MSLPLVPNSLTRGESNPPATAPTGIARGTPAYRWVTIAFFLVGFASFSLIYCVQPLFTTFVQSFHIGAAQSTLALSLTTGLLAVSILLMSMLGPQLSRRTVMFSCMTAAAVLTLLSAGSTSWAALLFLRAAEGVVLGGVPAIAMASLAELIDPRDLGRAMGLYVGGTAFGGMMGRVGMGLLTDIASWRVALLTMGALALLAALGFRLLVPGTARAQQVTPLQIQDHLSIWRAHLGRWPLLRLFLIGALNLGVFVAVFNALSFRLSGAPYHLGAATLSALFTVYLFGVVASPVGGALADRWGRSRVLTGGLLLSGTGLLLTLLPNLLDIVAGLVLLTVGFFTTHSVASSWVSRAAPAHTCHASALYLLAYYVGSSILGFAGAWCWTAGGWPWVVTFTAAALMLALVIAGRPELKKVSSPASSHHG